MQSALRSFLSFESSLDDHGAARSVSTTPTHTSEGITIAHRPPRKHPRSPSRSSSSRQSYQMHSLISSLTGSPIAVESEKGSSKITAGTTATTTSAPWRAYCTLIFGLLYQVSLGVLWTYGNVIPYVASYVAYQSEHHVTAAAYNNYYSLTNWSFFLLFTGLTFGVLSGGRLEIYFGPKICIIISSVFVLLGFGGTFLTLLVNNIYAVLLTYGVLFGFGIGLGYPVLTIVCMRWFPNTRGRICGIISGVFGGSPLLWDYVQTLIVNPNGVAIDPLVGYTNSPQIIQRIPFMFLYIAMIQFSMQLIALSIVRNPPWYTPERDQQQQTTDKAEQKVSKEQRKYEKHSLTMQMAVRLPLFWSLWINNFLFSFVLMWVTSEWKEFAIEYLEIDDDKYLAWVGSIAAMMNGLGRFGWGFVYDLSKSFRFSMGTQTLVVTLFIYTLPLLHVWHGTTQIWFAIWISLIWICVGCQYAFLPTCIAETFGAKYTGSIVGLFVWSEAPASLLVVLCTQFYRQLFRGWTGYCMFMASCCLMSFILSIAYKSNINRKKIIRDYETQHAVKSVALRSANEEQKLLATT